MSRKRTPKLAPGTTFRSGDGSLVQINEHGEEEPFVPHPWEPFPESIPDRVDYPRRPDGTIAPFYELDQQSLERMDQETPQTRRIRHDGWTIERQKLFVERLAETASWTDSARFVGLSRQSARNLYNRSPQFRAACDEALRNAVGVLAETAFDRAVNGVQEQVWYKGRMVGFREKYSDRLLMFLLRVRDPLNYAPLGDLNNWQRYRAIEQNQGIVPALERLEAAEQAWSEAEAEPPALPQPAERLEPANFAAPTVAVPVALEAPIHEPLTTPSHVTSSTTSPFADDAGDTEQSPTKPV